MKPEAYIARLEQKIGNLEEELYRTKTNPEINDLKKELEMWKRSTHSALDDVDVRDCFIRDLIRSDINVNFNVEIVKHLIRNFERIPGNSNGGTLHIVLEDYNINVGNLVYCLLYARSVNDPNAVELAIALLKMRITDRFRAIVGSRR